MHPQDGQKNLVSGRLRLEAQRENIICPADRVLTLYNEANEPNAKRISGRVRTWFTDEAQKKGWAGIHWVKEVQSKHGAGCVLARPPEKVGVSIKVTKTTLVLDED